MAFSDQTKAAAFRRSGGSCECTRKEHPHQGRCFSEVAATTADYHHIRSESTPSSHDSLSNCEVLCHECLVQVGTAFYPRSSKVSAC
jgi:hypothetical protein